MRRPLVLVVVLIDQASLEVTSVNGGALSVVDHGHLEQENFVGAVAGTLQLVGLGIKQVGVAEEAA